MTRTRNMADLLDSSGDIKSGALDNVPPSNDASALTTGTLPAARLPAVATSLVADATPQLGGHLDTNGYNINFGDNDVASFGAGSDLTINHDGSNSFISDSGTGSLFIQGTSGVFIRSSDGGENLAGFTDDGAATLYHDNSPKLATTSTGIDVTGNAVFGDNGKAIFGDSSEFQIYHTGSGNTVLSETGGGDLFIDATNLNFRNSTSGGESYLTAVSDGAVTLFHDNAAKLATKSDGVDITGELQADSLDIDGTADFTGKTHHRGGISLLDGDILSFGTGDDLQIFHDGGDSFISEVGTGNLQIRADDFYVMKQDGSEVMIRADTDSFVKLYHDGSEKLATTSSGISITGGATATGEITSSNSVSNNSNGIRTVMGNDGGSGVIGTSTNHSMLIATNNTTRMTVLASGGLTFNGDTATANALDDYEEGNFTPNYVGFSISSVSSNNGRYTKIGNTVMVQVDLQQVTWTAGGGHLGISNLPFAGGAQRAFTGTFAWYYLVNNLATTDSLHGYIAGGASSMMMYASQSGHIWHTIVTPSSGSNGYFNGTFWYRT